MANSLADQLGWCITTKDYLNNLNAEMIYVGNQYESMVAQLTSSGYMQDLLPMIESMKHEFHHEVRHLIKYIEDEHLAYIHTQSSAIAGTIESLAKN